MTVTVVTAITAGRDRLKQQPRLPDAEYVAFVDRRQRCPGWTLRPVYAGFADPERNAKHHKVLTHRWFPSSTYSLWVDGSIRLTFRCPLQDLVETYLQNSDLVVFAHRKRDCIYDEAQSCVKFRKDDPDIIAQQVERYRSERYPMHNGLAETSVMLRRHTERANRFCEAWWEEIATGSRRDQLSFDYVAWKFGIRYAVFPGTLADNALFHRAKHEPKAGKRKDRIV